MQARTAAAIIGLWVTRLTRDTSTLPRDNGTHFTARRGHYPQLSISDDSHHVTEAIGHMYDDEADVKSEGASVARRTSTPRKQTHEGKTSNGNLILGPNSQTQAAGGKGGGAWEQSQALSPTSLNARERSGSDTALSPFPLNNIDYESSPAAVAKELSNLQALRRMSMNADLGAADDPDLPQFNAAAVPSTPSHSEDDSSRLFWVPARLHPELAPKEFKTFLDSKAEQIKRRDSGLRRKQSMLSRQIHSPVGYQDGADRLEKKKSGLRGSPDLEELESLVSETGRLNMEAAASENGDIILPSVPSASLKRSKRTNFRRGGSVQTRSDRGTYAQPTPSAPTTFDSILAKDEGHRFSTASTPERRPEPMGHLQPRPESAHDKRSVPLIVQVPPAEDALSQPPSHPSSSAPPVQGPIRHPERSSSREAKMVPPPQRHGVPGSKQAPSTAAASGPSRAGPPPHSHQASSMRMNQPLHSLEQPSLLPGNNSGTQELTFIPTLTIDKRADQKKKDEPKKSGWSWLLGKEEDKDRSDKLKYKLSRPAPSDNTRLDVLQTSIDGQRSRESVVLDRESIKLEEERKKESARKSAGSESKKEKDSFLSSIFGGKKGKEKDTGRKNHRLSPEPVHRELKPDVDYNWTRFSILEERAIYRLAHIKLANPRRSLYSQVLLSNFMYSYLAKHAQYAPQQVYQADQNPHAYGYDPGDQRHMARERQGAQASNNSMRFGTGQQQNSALLSSLSAKTTQLKSITLDIYDNARAQETLDNTNEVFSSMGTNLRSSVGRLGRMARQGDRASVIKLAALIVGVVLLLYLVLGGLWRLVFGR
ncbi:hypothetical protein DV737_g2761, partial [Chaetothyriales sp. CBS 132003]